MIQQRQLLDGQLNENQNVLEELNKLTEDKNTVYKLIGPILVKQSLTESKQNVTKRIDYISKELQKCNDRIVSIEKTNDSKRENLQKLQQQLSLISAMKWAIQHKKAHPLFFISCNFSSSIFIA